MYVYSYTSLNIYFLKFERECACGGGAERDGERESQAGSKLSAWTPSHKWSGHDLS